MNRLKSVFEKNIVKYFLCSASTALLEFVLLLLLKRLFGEYKYGLVFANTLSVAASSFVHFILTSKLVFKVKVNVKSAVVYIITFAIGLLIQNSVLWFCYNDLFNRFITNDDILTVVSKCISLAASFIVTYFLRKVLNEKIKEKEHYE